MGMDQKVVFATEKMPTWSMVVEIFARRSLPLQLRMIDGELSFPDEIPGANWRELRVSVTGGMMTLRRDADGVTLVIWGNADAEVRRAWNGLTWALAHLTGGTVGSLSADDFRKSADLPSSLRED
jgi:hypothetical protein